MQIGSKCLGFTSHLYYRVVRSVGSMQRGELGSHKLHPRLARFASAPPKDQSTRNFNSDASLFCAIFTRAAAQLGKATASTHPLRADICHNARYANDLLC